MPSPATDDDRHLVGLVARGSEAALAVLYDRYAATILRTAIRVGAERDVAEEVVQETFLALWDRAERFDPAAGTLAGWLSAIARNRAIDRHRAAERRIRAAPLSRLTDSHDDPTETVDWLIASGRSVTTGTPAPEPDAVVVAGEIDARVAAALAGLTPDEREAIVLAYQGGLSQTEIATRLGWPIGTVKTRSRRALRRLREALESVMPDGQVGDMEADPTAASGRVEGHGATRHGAAAPGAVAPGVVTQRA